MHIHSSFSSCSVINIPQLMERAIEIGLDGICITDHDTTDAKSIIEDSVDCSGICIIVGIEYTTTKGDFLVFGPVEYIPKGLDAENLLRWINREGGVAIPAHPFREDRPVDINILGSSKVIEGLNGRNKPHENELCNKWLDRRGNGMKIIGGSDAHTIEEVGRIVTVFKKNIYSIEDLIEELRYGHYCPQQRDPL